MSENEDDTPMLLLRSAAQGTAAKILTTHMLIALTRKGVLTPGELDELLDASKAFAKDLGGPSEFVDLVLQSLDPDSRRPPEKAGDVH